ncbi:MAG: hypothetical protein DMD58_07475 [Gemmatimonadetes bacterium]|nr:MAG: hypothetical protein DMD58_07475 [Gemmatimonadota bacterium]
MLALTAAGCGESTGPLADLSGLGTSVAVVNTVFASPLVHSLDVFRFGVPLAAPAAGAPLIPDSLLGKTLAFTCASQRYAESGDSGAPATGVRVVLYQRAPDGSIACPATAIGQLDLFDASAPGTTAVRGVATAPGGAAPLVDYTISHSAADPENVASATGFVSDGQQRLDFQVTGEPGSGLHNTIATVQLDDSAADLHAVLHHAAEMGVDTYGDDLDLSVQHAAGSAELKGSVGWANTLRSWDEIVLVNDAPFAKVGGSFVPENEGPSISPIGGRPFFTDEERRVLLDFVGAPNSIRAGLAGVLGAGARLVRIAL